MLNETKEVDDVKLLTIYKTLRAKQNARIRAQKQREKRKAAGMCTTCGKYRALSGKSRCQNCTDRQRRLYEEKKRRGTSTC